MTSGSTLPDRLAGAPAVPLANGVLMPLLGLGVWQIPRGETEQAVLWALEAGYRHVNTAPGYGNEAGVGRGVRASGLPREEVFVTTKLRPGRGPARRQLEESLGKLGLEHVDLYLIHWAGRGAEAHWPEMERLLADGLARAIGVSNYGRDLLRRTVEAAEVPPMVNQIEWHPGVFSPTDLTVHRELGVVLESYSPLGRGRLPRDPGIGAIARRLGRTPAQVLLRWCVQRGIPTIPKSRTRDRIVENAALGFELSPGDMESLDGLRRG